MCLLETDKQKKYHQETHCDYVILNFLIFQLVFLQSAFSLTEL